ncbi:MAG: ABC transporter permease [Candidatus Zipacnadales bacterium]
MTKFQAVRSMVHKSPSLTVGALGFTLLLLIVLVGPPLARTDPTAMNYATILLPPGPRHPMGTDDLGRDLFVRVLYGGRISLAVGAATMLLTGLVGAGVGLLSGYLPRVDAVLMRLMDILMSFPSLLLALAIMASLGSSPLNVVVALSLAYTPRTARVVRSVVLAVRQVAYVEAARALGLSTVRILARHVLPAAIPALIVQQTFTFAYAVLGEAGLSFVGVGIQPPTPSWGNIIGDARPIMQTAPWMVFFAGGAIMLCVLLLNLFGDGLREILDPKRRHVQT